MLETAQILLIRLIRRAAEKSREVPDRRELSSLRAGREAADFHVLEHAPAQRADGFVSHGSAPCVETKVGEPQSQHATDPARYNTDPPPAAANYRESSLARWRQARGTRQVRSEEASLSRAGCRI